MNRLPLFPETTLREMMNSELETERENLFVIPGACSLVRQARRAGANVLSLQVGHEGLSQDFLRGILVDSM